MPSSSHPRRRLLPLLIAGSIVAATLLAGWAYRTHLRENPLSEDAVIQADVVHISAPVPGRIAELNVREGQRVQRGDRLFSLDQELYTLRLRQAEAELAVARAGLTTRERQIRAESANLSVAQEQIARARTNLDLANKSVQRLKPLAARQYVPQQQLDTALTAQRDAQISLSQAQAQAEAADALVGELDAAQAAVEVAEAAVAIARKALADTQVHAPNDGLVVGLPVSPGEHLAPDQALFTLINTERWYATAFFRETDLPEIGPEACALVYVLMEPGRALPGKRVDIGWGVASEDMVSLPRTLPYVQKTLNWVRVAQRFPVRVQLDSPPPELMRVGASASVVLRPAGRC